IRRGAITYNIPYTTTVAGARAVSEAIAALRKEQWQVRPLQEYYDQGRASGARHQASGKDKK
ncbi:MAG TPA: hypothetical protein PKH25_04645, partial [Syntrophales bacterium]|nr:hypothetical protein [Syntrophales bacterium]